MCDCPRLRCDGRVSCRCTKLGCDNCCLIAKPGMKAKDIPLPRPRMIAELGGLPGDVRRYIRSSIRKINDIITVKEFLIRHNLEDQIPWVLYPPHEGPHK